MEEQVQAVVITDIRMPFVSMVTFMLKWVIATIPTLIILFFLAKLAFQFWWWTFWD